MRTSIILLIALVTLATLAGCGSQSQTRAEFERDHPYAKVQPDQTMTDDRGNAFMVYVDHVPSHDFTAEGIGGARVTKTTHTNQYDPSGKILARGKFTD